MEVDAKLPNNVLQLFSILGLLFLAWHVFEKLTGRTVRDQRACTQKDHEKRKPQNNDARRIIG